MFDDGFIEEGPPKTIQPLGMGACWLCKRGPAAFPILSQGDENAPIVLVGEAPGEEEAAEGKVFVGPSGAILELALHDSGMADRDLWVTNALKCYKDSKPYSGDVEVCCENYLYREISAYPRSLIVAMGGIAQSAFGLDQWGVTDRVGDVLDFQENTNCPLICAVHPAYILRSPINYPAFVDTLKRGLEVADGTFTYREPPETWRARTPDEALHCLFNVVRAFECSVLSVDTETHAAHRDLKAFHWPSCGMIGLSLASCSSRGVWIPATVIDDRVMKELQTLFKRPDVRWIAHNAKFDRHVIERHIGPVAGEWTDTSVRAYFVDEHSPRGLKDLATMKCAALPWEGPTKKYMTDLRKCDPDVVGVYAATDAANTFLLHEYLPELPDTFAAKTTLRTVDCLYQMETAGVMLDFDILGQMDKALSEFLDHQLVTLRSALRNPELFNTAGEPAVDVDKFKPTKTADVRTILFDVLGLPVLKLTDKTKEPSTDKETLKELKTHVIGKPMGEVFLNGVMKYKRAQKLHSTYIKAARKLVSEDGCIHTTFNTVGTYTGRLSSALPNAQNQPKSMRPMFRARPGYVLIDVDYAQLEVVVAAAIANDPVMIDAVKRARTAQVEYREANLAYDRWQKKVNELAGRDVDLQSVNDHDKAWITQQLGWLDLPVKPIDLHRIVAGIIENKPPEEVTDEERRDAKPGTFGVIYGKDVYTFTQEFGGDEAKAQRLVDAIFGAFTRLKRWIDETHVTAMSYGQVNSVFGRTYHFPLARLASKARKGALVKMTKRALREAVNYLVQGSGSYVTLTRMCDCADALKAAMLDCQPLLNVHDSVVFECLEEHVDDALPLIISTLETPFEELGNIPLTVDAKISTHWGGDYKKAALMDYLFGDEEEEETDEEEME